MHRNLEVKGVSDFIPDFFGADFPEEVFDYVPDLNFPGKLFSDFRKLFIDSGFCFFIFFKDPVGVCKRGITAVTHGKEIRIKGF